MKGQLRHYLTLTLGLLICSTFNLAHGKSNETQADSPKRLVILVRHAEKAKQPIKDPQLSPKGMLRAQALIETLGDIPISRMIASQYTRTQATLAPISQQRAITTEIIPVRRPLASYIHIMQQQLASTQGNLLIAGHSNTVPMLIEAFGGPKIPAIPEHEYGKVYILSIPFHNPSDLLITSFGEEKK